ncbi:MAG: zinc-binding dehydrogenase [Gammaproteobacteria bacterium]|nr:zinc-binding dehydrogenase [Gammaproteobacteria bacterium]
MSQKTAQEIRLKQRPVGMPGPADFELATVSVNEPGAGEVQVRNLWMSVDPYMRGRMVDRRSYVPPFQVGEVLQGGAVGEVVESNDDNFAPGDHVLSMNGWREWYVAPAKGLTKVDGQAAPLQAYLGALGMPGMTAYAGLLRIGEPKDGETVFVSAASGAVGAIVCQIAKLKGCRVVASVGSERKAAWLGDDLGIDAVINYKSCGNLMRALRAIAPDGVDVYFENVGGEHLRAALDAMNPFGRIVMCGMISGYNDTEPRPGPPNLFNMIGKNLRMQGFIVTQLWDMYPDFVKDMSAWIAAGEIRWQETVATGIENAPNAFMQLFTGDNFGKMLVKLGA